jgi:phage gp29-like protein
MRHNNKTIQFTGKELAANWFDSFLNYVLDSIFYGYSLISLGDVENESFSDITLVKRWNVSPDRKHVSSYIYSMNGKSWEDDDVKDWHVYVSTPSEIGSSQCGFGLLYKVAPYEILLRNNLGYNADFNEMFNQPLRIGKTTKTDETERAEFEALLRDMGANPYALLDASMDSIEFAESKSIGTSYLSYSNFEERAQKVISKIILGHADALDSTAGKLGSDNGESPAQKALEDIQIKDGILICNVVNRMLIPRMIKLGFKIPSNYHFEFSNDREQKEVKAEEYKQNKEAADIAWKMKLAGLQMDAEYFTKETGIPATVLLTQVDIQKEKLETEIQPE